MNFVDDFTAKFCWLGLWSDTKYMLLYEKCKKNSHFWRFSSVWLKVCPVFLRTNNGDRMAKFCSVHIMWQESKKMRRTKAKILYRKNYIKMIKNVTNEYFVYRIFKGVCSRQFLPKIVFFRKWLILVKYAEYKALGKSIKVKQLRRYV